ncbi:unnamed protein product [Polarella glacialis]|uniref:PDZ domain-containing protein n=1 Tax=Polarella glacialis TaxID=89957 RepID=A0A813LYW7_POLGL|nr:unnamed protein product [Polarella glacialis]
MLGAFSRSGSGDPAPESFQGKVLSSLSKIESSLTLHLQKPPGQLLGMQLAPVLSGSALQVCGIKAGGLVDQYNLQVAAVASSGTSWWEAQSLRDSDIVEAVNGETSADDMMKELASSDSLMLRVRRPLQGGASVLPWLCEVDLKRNTARGERWGCQLSPVKDGSDTLDVTSVDRFGAVANWNQANPRLAIRAGDRVVAVGEEMGSPAMLAQLRETTATSCCWLVARGALMPGGVVVQKPPPEVICGPFRKRDGEKLGIRIGRAMESPLRGALVEPGCAGAMVVKEIVSGFLVDRWNQRPGVPRVIEGAVVLSVNGCRDPQEFATQLSKPSVHIRLRAPRAALGADGRGGSDLLEVI